MTHNMETIDLKTLSHLIGNNLLEEIMGPPDTSMDFNMNLSSSLTSNSSSSSGMQTPQKKKKKVNKANHGAFLSAESCAKILGR
jgi:hypothetical protein